MDARAWELFDPTLAPLGEDLRPFLREALRRAVSWFEADSASAFLVENPGEYVLAAQFGGIPLPTGTVLRAGVAQAAIRSREPLLVGDPADHPRLRDLKAPRRTDVASAMVLPLILPDGEAVGVINLGRKVGAPAFATGELDQARRMAAHFALSLGLAQRTVAAARLAREEAGHRHLAEIGRMTATLAHEIRNPLAAIRASAQLAPETPECLDIIVEEVDRLDALCEGFLDLSRPLAMKVEPTSLSGLLEGLAERERGVFHMSGVTLFVVTRDQETIPIDSSQVERACRNLLKNAREAVGNGGHVTLTVWRDGFEVTDDGPGLSPEIRDALFTPFVTAKPRGTGLGLTVVRQVAEAHGGRVLVEDRARGAAFRVELGVAA